MYKVTLERFEGPLDLLLQLIEKEDLDITQIALAQVTEQYLAYLEEVEETSPEELADFLVVAARLLLLKSRTILPLVTFDEEEDEADLTVQLKLYREFVKASEVVEKMLKERAFSYVRDKVPAGFSPEFHPPEDITAAKMKELYLGVIKSLEPLMRLPQQTLEKTISLQDKVQQLRDILQTGRTVKFSQLLVRAGSRAEIVVSFMAVLELLREQKVRVKQSRLFDDIDIEPVA